jgi:hypothetical protein
MIPAWKRQLRGEDFFIVRHLPVTAKPYRSELHNIVARNQMAVAAE